MSDKFFVADIGGSYIKTAEISSDFKIFKYSNVKTPMDYHQVIDLLMDGIAESRPDAVQISIPAAYDKLNDVMLFAPNLRFFNNMPLAEPLNRAGIPVFIENDANIATLGEYAMGYKDRPKSMILLTLGTGVGGGAVIEGKLVTGGITAMEIGHMTLVAEGRKCNCGKSGCIEQYCSVSGLEANYAEISGKSSPLDEIVSLCRKGDLMAKQAFARFALHLAHVVSSLINMFNPQSVRLGGGLSELHAMYMHEVKARLASITYPAYIGKTEVEVSTLKNHAAIYGGVEWILRNLKTGRD